jgi:hypothetical protein
MKVFTALMLDEDEVADHNVPTVLVAGSEGILRSKVREHIKTHGCWLEALECNKAEVDTMSFDEMDELLCLYEDGHMSIIRDETDV